MPFFISPPYQLPPMICMFSVRLNAINVSEFRPCLAKSANPVLEAFTTTKSGVKLASSSVLGRMNIFFTKCACHATSMTNRTLNRVSSLAPQNASTTKSRLPQSWLVAVCLSSAQTSGDIGLLSFLMSPFHQYVSRVLSSMVIYLSLGERPVYSPVSTLTAPSSDMTPRSYPVRSDRVSSLYNVS